MRNKREYIRGAVVLILAVGGLITSTAPFLTSSGLAAAQTAAPNWSYTGSLNTARLFHTTTLLANGKVLVVGGCNDFGCLGLDSAELYDPVTGTWGRTGSPNVDRVLHSATLLPNGKVLVAGGFNRGVLGSAELYDPVAGTWSFTGNLNVARADHSATLLPDGKVLVAGGFNYESFVPNELYDPATGTWSITGNLNMVRVAHTATLLPNGKVLVTGGTQNSEWSFYNLSSSELYDPNTGTWSLTGSLNVARLGLTATLLPNGNVLVTGGESQDGAINSSAELYNPTTGTWSYTGSFSTGRYGHTATLLRNGKVLVAGGHDWHTNTYLDSADVYDPATGNWSATAKLNVTRLRHTAVLLQSGKVLVVGGSNRASRLLSAELYDSGGNSTINPIDDPQFFVRQHYLDFLGREPDPAGMAGWLAVLNNCLPGDTSCDRIHVSSAFFRSPEFQGRGYFVYRFYPVAFGRKPDFNEFTPDLAKVSGFLTDAELEAAKVAFITEFMNRPAFVTKFNGLDNTAYVDLLLTTAGISHPSRDLWIAALSGGTRTRAQVLREIVEGTEVFNKYYNQAFVVIEYFGYLRRDPDALYLNWIQVLDANPADSRQMVSGFVNSLEYRARFGP